MKLQNPFTLIRRTCQAAEEVQRAAERLEKISAQTQLIITPKRDKLSFSQDPDKELKDA